MNPKVTTSFILDTRRAKTGNLFPVKLRLIHNRQNRLYSTIYDLTKEDFKKVMGEKPREEFKQLRKKLDLVENRAIEIIDGLKTFSFDGFSSEFYGHSKQVNDVFTGFEIFIKSLEAEDRIGNANAYTSSLKSLKKFHQKDILVFKEIDVPFLKKFENWSLSKGNSLTTVGIYLRCLRSIYNQAIVAKLINRDAYPFGRGRYEIPSPANVKKALSSADLAAIFAYQSENSTLMYHRDFWIFSYLCNGANIKDICLLRYRDICGDTIIFRRAKTSNTNRKSKPITAANTPHIKRIIEKWGNKPEVNEDFVFRILNPADNEKVIKNKVGLVVQQINKYMNMIAAELELPGRITTYTARHSFATKLKRSGVSTSFISEFLGHSSQRTTESYLGSIETPDLLKIAENLTTF